MKRSSGYTERRGRQKNNRTGEKAVLAVLAGLLLVLLFLDRGICVKADDQKLLMSEDIQRIVTRGELVVAIPAQDLLVFFEEADGQYSGVDVDLAQGIADSLGVKLTYDRSSETYDDMTEKLQKREVDLIIATYSMTSQRAKYVTFSDPYLTIHMGLMMNKQFLVRKEIEGNPLPYLKEHKVKLTAVKGTSHVRLLKELFPEAEVVEAKDYEDAYRMVRNGEAAGFLCGELEFFSAYLKDPSLRIYTSVFTFQDVNDQFAVGVSQETPQLLNYINTYLRTSKLETKQQVEERYVKAGKKNGKDKKGTG